MYFKIKRIKHKKIAATGAKLAVAGVFGYSLIVMLYVITRSSVTIFNNMHGKELTNILLLNAFSVAYAVAVFSLLMAVVSSISGAIAGVLLKKALQFYNPTFSENKAVAVSCIVAFTMLLVLYLLLYTMLTNWMTFDFIETFLFWFLLPAAIFFSVAVIAGIQLNKVLEARVNIVL